MSVSGFLLVLAAAFCHATWNFFVKRINGGAELIWLFSLVSLIIYMPLAGWILLVEKPQFTLLSLGFLAGSTVIHLGYFLLLQTGYRKGDLSLVYPIARATGPLLSTTFAVFFLSETVTVQMGVGAAIIIFGIFMLTGGLKPGAQNVSSSLFFGLAAGLLIGSYTAWDAYTVSILLVPPLLLEYASSIGRFVLLAPIAFRDRKLVRQHWSAHKFEVILIAIFTPLAYILVLYAMTFTPVSFVAPIREVSVLLTVFAGSLLLQEGDLKRRIGWAVIILSGIVVLGSA